MSAKISYKADSSAHSGVKLETPCSPSVPSISNWIKPEVSMLTSIMLVSVEHNWDLEHLILSYERILSSWTLTSSGVVSAWPPLTSAPAGSVSAVCPHHPPCGQKRGSPPDPDPTPDSPLQSRLQSQSNKLMIVSHLFVIYFTSYNGFIMVVGAYTRVLIKLDSHKSNFAHISVCPRWNTHIWDSKYTSYRIQAINHPGSSFIVIVNMIIFPPKDRLYIHTHTHICMVYLFACLCFCISLILIYLKHYIICVCVFVKKPSVRSWTRRKEFRLSFKSVSLLAFLQPHVRSYACPHILLTSKWTCVSVSLYIQQPVVIGFHSQAACLLWINILRPHLASLKHHASRPSEWRSMEATGSKLKPQTLPNTWAGLTFTILFTKNWHLDKVQRKLRLLN